MIRSYQDAEPILPLYAQACRYYRHHHIPTKIKACAFMTTQEILSVAPVVDAMTLPAEQLEELAAATAEGLDSGSRVVGDQKRVEEEDPPTRLSYVDDEGAFLRAYCLNARGRAKTEDVSGLLSFPLSFFLSFFLSPPTYSPEGGRGGGGGELFAGSRG